MKVPDQLKSRKFWIAVVVLVFFGMNGQYNEMAYVVLGYLGAQGATDALAKYNNDKPISSDIFNDPEVETGAIITGSQFNKKLEDEIDPNDEDWKEEA